MNSDEQLLGVSFIRKNDSWCLSVRHPRGRLLASWNERAGVSLSGDVPQKDELSVVASHLEYVSARALASGPEHAAAAAFAAALSGVVTGNGKSVCRARCGA